MIASLVTLVVSVLCLQWAAPSRWTKWLTGMVGLGVMAMAILGWVSVRLTGSDFNEAMIYHLQVGLEGSPIKDFRETIVLGVSGSVALVGGFLVLIWRTPWSAFSTPRGRIPSWFPLVGALAALALNPTMRRVVGFLASFDRDTVSVSDYKEPQPLSPLTKPVNFVWIYLESFERTYLDEKLFPGLTPHIKAIEAESLTFTKINQHSSASWTVAGMVASQCGVPLPTLGGPGQSLGAFPSFLPGATCIGDLLQPLGYHLSYLGGS